MGTPVFFRMPLPLPPLSRVLTGLALAAPMALAHAARPMITDDARIVDAKACQVESWAKTNRGSDEFWALPACNFSGNLEITAGAARTREGGALHTTDLVLQGKTIFRPLETNNWSWGLAIGHVQHPDHRSRFGGDVYAYVPATFSFRDDRVFVHTNLGWLREQQNGRHHATWGIGTEVQMTDRTWLIGEGFGQNQGSPFYQFGVRHWIVPNHVQIDTTYGNRLGSGGVRGEERWFSLGLRLLSLPFLP